MDLAIQVRGHLTARQPSEINNHLGEPGSDAPGLLNDFIPGAAGDDAFGMGSKSEQCTLSISSVVAALAIFTLEIALVMRQLNSSFILSLLVTCRVALNPVELPSFVATM